MMRNRHTSWNLAVLVAGAVVTSGASAGTINYVSMNRGYSIDVADSSGTSSIGMTNMTLDAFDEGDEIFSSFVARASHASTLGMDGFAADGLAVASISQIISDSLTVESMSWMVLTFDLLWATHVELSGSLFSEFDNQGFIGPDGFASVELSMQGMGTIFEETRTPTALTDFAPATFFSFVADLIPGRYTLVAMARGAISVGPNESPGATVSDYELMFGATVIPLPAPAALGVAGLATLAVRRRRSEQ